MSESGFLLGVWKHFLARYHQSIKVNHNSRHDTELIMHKITIKFIQKKKNVGATENNSIYKDMNISPNPVKIYCFKKEYHEI